MRKDIFIVGIRLLGLWQLLGAANSLAGIITIWLGYLRPQSTAQEYYILHFAVQLVTGLYLIFRPYRLFNLMARMKEEEMTIETNADEQSEDGNRENGKTGSLS